MAMANYEPPVPVEDALRGGVQSGERGREAGRVETIPGARAHGKHDRQAARRVG